MSGGPRRPPVPGLIPLAALSRRSIDDGSKSRGIETTRATAPGRQRPHRRRKSVAVSKQSRSASPALDRPPRVNPIFVWVRQEDTHIVEVKCEDYDKRNRILLTKTAHGWRAIPRTEMLGAPRASAEPAGPSGSTPQRNHHHRHHHHHRRRARKSKTHQQSASVQFPDDHDSTSEPSWVTSENVNIESLLPSHTIHVKRTESPTNPSDETNVVKDTSHNTSPDFSPPDKTCDVSPLENLLAVAELELKQHIQSEKWQESASQKQLDTNTQLDANEPSDNNPSIEEIDELIKTKAHELQIDLTDDDRKSPECSYNDDDEMSMNDILSRLEQSLQSPHGFGSDNTFEDEILDQDTDDKVFDSNDKPIPNDFDGASKTPTSYETTTTDNYIENPIMDYSSNDCYIQETLGDENKVVDNVKVENDEEIISLQNGESNSIQDLISEEHKSEKNESEEIYKSNGSQEATNDSQKDDINTECEITDDKNENSSHFSEPVVNSSSDNQTCPEVQDVLEINEEKELLSPQAKEHSDTEFPTMDVENKIVEASVEAESSTIQEDQIKTPKEKEEGTDVLDLSVKKNEDLEVKIDTVPEPATVECDEGPTDLSIRKPVLTFNFELPSPASQSSEVSQSPQPSGIPAVPPSPDLVTTSTTISKPRSVFLESLLANSMNKNARKAINTVTKQKEPLDLGKSRKSASPTVTCSEEIVHSSEFEPPAKRLKPDEITLKNLLEKDSEPVENCLVKSASEPSVVPESTRPTVSASNQKNHFQNPLAEFKQLLEEIDIPNPLMVPKDIFPDLLKHPKQEILKILSGQSKKNITLDDILVVYKDKLLAAIEASQNHSAPVNNCHEGLKAPIEKPTGSSEKPVQVSTKRKSTDNSISKGPNISPDSKSSLANDIDVANEAALFWAGCPNPFEAMANYANHTDLIQALYNASTFPYFPSQLGELHPGLQMMLGAKMAPPLSFPPPPPVNINNPFEMSMWQEAMMQASLLQNKNPYENSILNQPNYKSNIEPKSKNHMQQSYANRLSSRHGSNGHGKNIHQNQQQQFLASTYGQNIAGNESSWQNPYLGLAGFQQGSNNLTLNIPQFNPFGFKNNPTSPTSKHSQLTSPSHLPKQNREAKMINKMNSESEKKLHLQEQHKLQQMQQQKMLRQQHQYQLHQLNMRQATSQKQQSQSGLAKKNCIPSFSSLKECIQEKTLMDGQRPGLRQGPIDLSGAQKKGAGVSGSGRSTVTSSKSGGDDIPEVGSTTGSIEDMQDQHTQLWHPLFGSHNKGYNPWSLPSLTAMGE